MIKSRFIRLYRSLDKLELRQLKKWVNSPLHNQHKEVVKLFEYLEKRRKISAISVKKERVFTFIFPNQKYQEEKLSIVMNYALNTLKSFIGYLESLSNDFNNNKQVILGLEGHQMTHLAQLQLNKCREKVEKDPLQNAEKSWQQLELECIQFDLVGTSNRTIQTNIPNIFHHLNDFYCLSILRYACIAYSHSNLIQQQYEIPLLNQVLALAYQSKHPILRLYYNVYQSLDHSEESRYFYTAEELFLEYHHQLNDREQQEILLLLINYCIKRLNSNAAAFRTKALDWYKWGLESKIILSNNQLSRFAFSNVVAIALKLKEFDWVTQFIDHYNQYLSGEFRENYTHYTTAKLYFSQKRYDQAQKLLVQVEYDDIFLNLDAKTMLLEIFYEEKNIDALEALLTSFARYLQRKSVMAYHRKIYQNIIYVVQKLLYLSPFQVEKKAVLKQEIETLNPLAERDWLLEQLAKI